MYSVPMTLDRDFKSSTNSLNLIRFACASAVLFSHTGWMSQHDVSWVRGLGPKAVVIFFGISGFLLSRSLSFDTSPRKYLWNRFLRIYPGFMLMLISTAILIAPLSFLLSGGKLLEWNWENSIKYVVSNSLIHISTQTIGSTPSNHGFNNWNPSLWTLQYEILCYLLLLLLFRVASHKIRDILITTCFVTLNILIRLPVHLNLFVINISNLLIYFLFGCCVYLFSNLVSTNFWILLLTFGIFLFASIFIKINILQFSSLILFFLIFATKVKFSIKNDYSYGLYIYGGPATNLALSILGPRTNSIIVLNFLSFGLALMWAVFSWHLVEKPFLKRKI